MIYEVTSYLTTVSLKISFKKNTCSYTRPVRKGLWRTLREIIKGHKSVCTVAA